MIRLCVLLLVIYCQVTAAALDSLYVNLPVEDTSNGFIELAGDLPLVISAVKGPYIVIADIYVSQSKTVIIEPGTVLLFKSFTALHVQGILVARGTKENPIIFTSINDRQYNKDAELDAAPYDWNGIIVHQDAIGSQFIQCQFLYSVFGIESMTRFIQISSALFLHNGRSNLTIEGKDVSVGEKPFQYVVTVDEARKQGVPLTILKDPRMPIRSSYRYAGLAIGISAAGLAIYYTEQFP